MARKPTVDLCPCGSGLEFGMCCKPYLDGLEQAPNAEALMRSRYTAYVKGEVAYLLASWHADTRPATLELDPPGVMKWLGLTVLASGGTPVDGCTHEVEFIARAKISGRAVKIHERSAFRKEADGRWYYVDGIIDS